MLYYQIATISVPWDNSYNNVLRFDSRAQQEEYFGVGGLFAGNPPTVNFNVSNFLNTAVVIDDSAEPLPVLLGRNYAVVKNTQSVTHPLKYYYYFISQSRQLSGGRIELSLELDIFQTYYMDAEFSQCLIERAHLNRWKQDEYTTSGNVRFWGDPDSPLLNSEGVNAPKYLRQRSGAQFQIDNRPNSPLDQWLADNVSYWAMFFFVRGAQDPEEFSPWNGVGPLSYTQAGTTPVLLSSNLVCIIAPVIAPGKGNFRFVGTDGSSVPWNLSIAWDNILAAGHNYSSYVADYKISSICPIPRKLYVQDTHYTITTTGDRSTLTITDPVFFGLQSSLHNNGLGLTRTQLAGKASYYTYSDIFPYEFSVQDIVAASEADPAHEPKLYSADIQEIRLTDQSGNTFSYDPQKLNSGSKWAIMATEPIKVGTTNGYACFYPRREGAPSVYDNSNTNYTGLCYNNDWALVIEQTQLAQFLAQNKNFSAIQSAMRDYNMINAGVNMLTAIPQAVGRVATGNLVGAGISYAGDVVGGFVGAAVANEKNKVLEAYTLDNMASAPSSLTNAQGNALLTIGVNIGDAPDYRGKNIYVDYYSATEADKAKAFALLLQYGYSYARLDNIKNVDNIRKYYNYVQASPDMIDVPYGINDSVHHRFKDAFSRGVRFWNASALPEHRVNALRYDYTLNNYENYLDTM